MFFPELSLKQNLDRRSGFSLLELILVISLMGILGTMVAPSLTAFRNRAERLVCNNNLRSLHVSLASYLADNKQWPQISEELQEEQVARFWVDTLTDYGGTQGVWQCPSWRRLYSERPEDFSHNPIIHYIPSQFDEHHSTPTRWPRQPWVMEVGSFHGDGNMFISTDGSIHSINEFLQKASGS